MEIGEYKELKRNVNEMIETTEAEEIKKQKQMGMKRLILGK